MPVNNAIPSLTSTYSISSFSQIWTLAAGQSINSPSIGIFEWSDYYNNTIVVNGTIAAAGTNAGIDSFGAGTSIEIGANATVTGYQGVRGFGDHFTLINNGKIGGTTSVFLSGDFAKLINNNNIQGQIQVDSDSGQSARIVNRGELFTTLETFIGGDGNETLINRGILSGYVRLGYGNDVYDNRNGVLSGTVAGNAGNDTYIIDDTLYIMEKAGEGTDTVKSTFTMNLQTNYYLGSQEIENLVLLGKKNINGFGNDLDNVIKGNSGNNHLSGGYGDDRLTGGKGADIFVFKNGFEHDRVTDFGHGSDRIDLSHLAAATTFSNMMAHHLARSGSNLIIHYGTDHLTLEDTAKSDLQASDFIF